MRTSFVVAVVVTTALVIAYGPAAFGGHFAIDGSANEDTLHLSVLYETWGGHVGGGAFPWWFPEFGGGYPVGAAWMYGLMYPGLLLFAWLPVESAWAWTAILHTAFGAFGATRLARRAGCGDSGALAAGLVFGLSEYLVVRPVVGHLNLLLPMAWAPWVFVHLIGVLQGRARAAPWFVFCTALGLLSGHVQTWFYLAPAALLLVLVALRNAYKEDGRLPVRVLVTLALSTVLVLLLTSLQWAWTAELMSVAGSAEASHELRSAGSIGGAGWAARAVPGVLGRHDAVFPWGPYAAGALLDHEWIGLAGAWLLVPALAAFASPRLALPWALVAVLGALLATGTETPIGRAFHAVPLIGSARAPARALVMTVVALPVLVGLGVNAWLDLRQERPAVSRRALGVGVVCAVLALVAGVVLGRSTGGVGAAQVRPAAALAAVGIAASFAALFLGDDAGWRRFLPGIVLGALSFAVALPPIGAAGSDVYRLPWHETLPPGRRTARVHVDGNVFPPIERGGTPSMRRMSHVDLRGQDALYGRDADAVSAYWYDVGFIAQRAWDGLVWTPPEGDAADLVLWKQMQTVGAGTVHRRAADRLLTKDSGTDVMARLRAAPPGSVAFVRDDAAGGERTLWARTAPLAAARVLRTDTGSPNDAAWRVESPSAGVLIVPEKRLPGWDATVNGEPAALHVANLALRAVDVPAGESEVRMRYRPRTLLPALVATFAGFVVLLLSFLRGRGLRAVNSPGLDSE